MWRLTCSSQKIIFRGAELLTTRMSILAALAEDCGCSRFSEDQVQKADKRLSHYGGLLAEQKKGVR